MGPIPTFLFMGLPQEVPMFLTVTYYINGRPFTMEIWVDDEV